MDVPVEDRQGVDVGFAGAEGEKDRHRGGLEMPTVSGQPNGDGCVRAVGEESMGEDALLDVLRETGPGEDAGLAGLAGLRRGALLCQGREVCCRWKSMSNARRVEMHGRHRAASRGKTRLLRPDFEDGHDGKGYKCWQDERQRIEANTEYA